MTFRMRTVAMLVPAFLLALPAAAANLQIKPGLWENTGKVDAGPGSGSGAMATAMAAMQQQMASMTPEQRKSIEAVIAKNGGGFTMPTVNAQGALVSQACLTQEMIDKSHLPTPENQGGCTHQASPVVNGVLTATFTCTNPPTTGKTRFVIKDEKSYTMTMESTTTMDGKPQVMKVNGSGRWLASDCGSVKPRAVSATSGSQASSAPKKVPANAP